MPMDTSASSGWPARLAGLAGFSRDASIEWPSAASFATPKCDLNMPVQAVALVLGEHADLPDPAVDQVGQREVDQPVQAAERNRRLGPLRRPRRQPPPRRARQDNAKN